MDDENLAIETITAAAATTASSAVKDSLPLKGQMADYSPDDDDLDEAVVTTAAEATRDTLADGLVARLLRPCVDRLDASVQCTRLSQLDLKLQLDSLATELKRLSLAQHDYLFCNSMPQSPSNKSTAATTFKTTTDTCLLLDGYARRLCDARAKIAVVGNILESTQDRLRALSHRIGREHNNRRSLLEPPAVVTNNSEESEFEMNDDNEKDEIEELNANKNKNQNINSEDSDTDVKKNHLLEDDTKGIKISPVASKLTS